MKMILHIAKRKDWEDAVSNGGYKPASIKTDGFIHCSTIEQTVETANQYFTGQRDLVILCIDTGKVEAQLKYEAPAGIHDQRVDLLFPHIYGELNVNAVVKVLSFVPNDNGIFELPKEIADLEV